MSGCAAAASAALEADTTIHLAFLCVASARFIRTIPSFMAAACNRTHSSDSRPSKFVVHVLTDLLTDAPHVLSWPRFAKGGACWSGCVHMLNNESLSASAVARFTALRSRVESHPWSRNNYNFMYKVMLHDVLPSSVRRVIVLDHDMLVLADLRGLWELFDRFRPTQMLGLAEETQPTYHPCGTSTEALRRRHPGRKTGYLAFNGGLQLLDLHKLRRHGEYNSITNPAVYGRWTDERRAPWSGGRCTSNGGVWDLGDQDLYALLGIDHPEWFYTVPCAWNVQLSTYNHERHNLWPPSYPELQCTEPPAILHGNFRTSSLWGSDYHTPSCTDVKRAFATVHEKHPEIFVAVEEAFC